MKSSKISKVIFFISLIFLLILYVVSFRFRALDDVFIYFNYAKKFAEGYYFAFDARNIPAEGFTSFLYYLFLSTIAILKLDLLYTSVFFNFIFLFGSVALSGHILVKNLHKDVMKSLMFYSFALFLIYLQPYGLYPLLGLSLETLMALFFGVILISYFFKIFRGTKNRNTIIIFHLVFFFLFLLRPESIFIFSPLPIAIFIKYYKNFKILIFPYAITICLFISYLAFKFIIFDDILPTGFYRKVGGEETSRGLNYVLQFFKFSIPLLCLIIILLFFNIRFKILKNFKSDIIIPLALVVIFNLLFFIFSNPLIGIFFRFMVFSNFILVITAVFLVYNIFNHSKSIVREEWFTTTINIFSPVLIIIVSGLLHFNVYAQRKHNKSKVYLELGEKLNKEFGDENISYLLGEAGAIPYKFNANFIDFNGLSEPYIAKLFKTKFNDSIATEDSLINYAEKNNLDFIMMFNSGKRSDSLWVFDIKDGDSHSPLNGKKLFAFYQKINKKKYTYEGTYFCRDNLSFTFFVRNDNPRRDRIKTGLKKITDRTSAPKEVEFRYENQSTSFKLN